MAGSRDTAAGSGGSVAAEGAAGVLGAHNGESCDFRFLAAEVPSQWREGLGTLSRGPRGLEDGVDTAALQTAASSTVGAGQGVSDVEAFLQQTAGTKLVITSEEHKHLWLPECLVGTYHFLIHPEAANSSW